jgi:hypothetical protein
LARRKQSRRVAAWIYSVINPVAELLEREVALLEAANLTWRAGTSRCQFIRPIREYVEATQWPNYQDFCVENVELSQGFTRHDENVERIEALAAGAFRALLDSRLFTQLLDQHTQTLYADAALEGQGQSKSEIYRVAAENVVNNVKELPPHYVYAKLWNAISPKLFPWKHGEMDLLLAQEGALAQFSLQLVERLRELRLKLVREHDVPAASVAGLPLER